MLKWIKNLLSKSNMEDPYWRDLKKDERDILIESILERLDELEESNEALVLELGEIATYCDKCGQNSNECFKCQGTGIVKRKQLFEWPW